MSAWQPIETAPKDGTTVLLWIEYGDDPAVGRFRHGKWTLSTEHYEVSCGAYCLGGSPTTQSALAFTHWMPLPTTPLTDTKETPNA